MPIPLLPLLAALAASVAWAGLDASRKVLVARIERLPLLAWIAGASAPVFAVWVLIEGVPVPEAGYWAPALGSVALNVVANLAYFRAVEVAPLSLTIPLLSLTPVATTLLGAALLGERPTGIVVLGILLVVAGALALHARGIAGALRAASDRAAPASGGAALMALTAVLWSLTIAFDKLAVRHAAPPFHGMVLTGGVGLAATAMLAARGRLRDLGQVRRAPGVFALAWVIGTAALGLQLVALGALWVSLVETLKRGIGNALAVVLGRVLFGERPTAATWIAVAVMAAGVALILL